MPQENHVIKTEEGKVAEEGCEGRVHQSSPATTEWVRMEALPSAAVVLTPFYYWERRLVCAVSHLITDVQTGYCMVSIGGLVPSAGCCLQAVEHDGWASL